MLGRSSAKRDAFKTGETDRSPSSAPGAGSESSKGEFCGIGLEVLTGGVGSTDLVVGSGDLMLKGIGRHSGEGEPDELFPTAGSSPNRNIFCSSSLASPKKASPLSLEGREPSTKVMALGAIRPLGDIERRSSKREAPSARKQSII